MPEGSIKQVIPRRSLRGLLVALLLSGCAARASSPIEVAPSPTSRYDGIELPTHRTLPHVVFTDTGGHPYDPAAHATPITLLFTGYTHCPDVCPATMADIASALRKRPALRSQVRVLFVTTDPRRDTLPRLRSWLDGFDPTFLGLRGTVAQVTELSGALGLPLPEDDGTTHSSELLALTRTNASQLAWLDSPSPDVLLHDLTLLMQS